MINPWSDEPKRIQNASLELARQHGGALTQKLLNEAEENGWLNPPHVLYLHIDVRCTYQKSGDHQHTRTQWHQDGAKRAWLWVDGPGPTEFESGPVETKKWHEYGLDLHRCPEQPEDGWRYFLRVIWSPNPPYRPLVLQ